MTSDRRADIAPAKKEKRRDGKSVDHTRTQFCCLQRVEAGETWMYFLSGSSAGFRENNKKLHICSEPSKIRGGLNCQKLAPHFFADGLDKEPR